MCGAKRSQRRSPIRFGLPLIPNCADSALNPLSGGFRAPTAHRQQSGESVLCSGVTSDARPSLPSWLAVVCRLGVPGLEKPTL